MATYVIRRHDFDSLENRDPVVMRIVGVVEVIPDRPIVEVLRLFEAEFPLPERRLEAWTGNSYPLYTAIPVPENAHLVR